MTRRWLWISALAVCAAVLVFWGRRIEACGPFIPFANFKAPPWPDTYSEEYRGGDLGILRGSLRENDLVIAWRYLSGLGASPIQEREPDWLGTDVWLKARSAVVKGDVDLNPHSRIDNGWSEYQRIHAAAFLKAAETLEDRLARFGKDETAIRAWIQGQDMVFASTREIPQISKPVDHPDWLKKDRNYQRAAALFYAERFEEARLAFAAIDQDPFSPWQPWAKYLQARCYVREASLSSDDPTPVLDPGRKDQIPGEIKNMLSPIELYRKAQVLLDAALKECPEGSPMDKNAEDYRELVRHYTEPAQLLGEAQADLAALQPKALDHALSLRRSARTACLRAKIEPPPPGAEAEDMEEWISVMRTNDGNALDAALVRYRQKPGLPWLIAALIHLRPGDERAASLLADAAKIKHSSPAYNTLHWQQIRLESLDRAGLEAALREKLPVWAVNELRKRRAALAGSALDWAEYSLRLPEQSGGFPFNEDDVGMPILWPEAEAEALNRNLSLAQLQELVLKLKLPHERAEELARAVWTRAVLLERLDVAQALVPCLEKQLGDEARGVLRLADPAQKRFGLARLILCWPGLRPYVNANMGGARQWNDSAREYNNLRDNWWCEGMRKTRWSVTEAGEPEAISFAFMNADEREAVAVERAILSNFPAAQVWIGEAVLAYARKSPDDPMVPEALHDVVSATGISTCDSPAVSAVSRKCFRLLHRRYAKSEWAKKTPYYY